MTTNPKSSIVSYRRSTAPRSAHALFIFLLICLVTVHRASSQSQEIRIEKVQFESQKVKLAGSIFLPDSARAAIVLVDGSGLTLRMSQFAAELCKSGIAVLTYDKRGVGESGGTYRGPEVGSNNIDTANLNLLAHDASSAINLLQTQVDDVPVGLLGFSQAGWIIPLAAAHNPNVSFIVLFSCPTITTLEQLRFQFFADGNENFWEEHTEAEAQYHTLHDPDRYSFEPTDPKASLQDLSIPGLWVYGKQDIQIPVNMCIQQLNSLKAVGKPYEYVLFSELGHNTAFAQMSTPLDIAIQWILRRS